MKYFSFLFPALLALLTPGCRGTVDPVNTSVAFPETQISLGGIIAGQLAGVAPADSGHQAAPDLLVPQIEELLRKTEELKKSRGPVGGEPFNSLWNRLSEQALGSFDRLSANDIRSWIALNDTLLKYSGEGRFADQLERMAYNVPVPEIAGENMIKSFCYTRMYDRVYVNLLGNSEVEFEHTTGGKVKIVQQTGYPFDGRIRLRAEVQDTRYIDLFVRIPAWARESSVTMKGVAYKTVPGGYTELGRKWKNGDEVEIRLGFDTEVIRSEASAFAFSYGPVLLSYAAAPGESFVFRGERPQDHLSVVSKTGDMITCNFTGIPDQTVVLQPFFARHDTALQRRAWFRTVPE